MKNAAKGYFGELKFKIAAFFILGFSCKIINNATLPIANSKTRFSQIDHIIISRKGVFVVETKNFSGRITVNETSEYWWQGFGVRGYKFYSPIQQNEGHISALKYLLRNPNLPYVNIVAFVGGAVFSDPSLPDGVYRGVLSSVRGIKSYSQDLLTDTEVDNIYNLIQEKRLPNTLKTRRKHIESLKER